MTLQRDTVCRAERQEAAQLVVCEQTGRWAVALRRELPEGWRLHETRSLAACWATLVDCPASFVIVEATHGNLDALLTRLASRHRDFPRARVAVVTARDMACFRWLLGEAGAVAVVTSPRRLGALAAVACRHLAGAPRAPQSAMERIWSELPWTASATS